MQYKVTVRSFASGPHISHNKIHGGNEVEMGSNAHHYVNGVYILDETW